MLSHLQHAIWLGTLLSLAGRCFGQEPIESDLAFKELQIAAEQAITEGKHQKAVQLLKKITQLEPRSAVALYHLGRESFCVGEIEQSLTAFDRYLELAPSRKTSLWERGITCYYAKKYEQGRKQFELYQTFHNKDVENGVWHILCESGINGFQKASSKALEITDDPRVPMTEIYDLFRGKAKPKDVMDAANTNASKSLLNRQKFYANLYVGLYYEATGDGQNAKQHLQLAVKHRIGHYMWHVARVHLERIEKQETEEGQ